MANVLKFELRKEIMLDKDLKPVNTGIEEGLVSLYATVDGLESYVQHVKSLDEARELIKPEKIDSTLVESMSLVEVDEIYGVLSVTKEYYLYDEEFIYGSDKIGEEEKEEAKE